MPFPVVLKKKKVPPGEHVILNFPIGHLPSGTAIDVAVHVFQASEPGPVILLLAGMHGDEINSIEILRRALTSTMFEGLKRGAVIAVPLLNVFGFINFSRDVPDGKDVNRSFPGSSRGSLASRVAYLVSRELLPSADLIIDLHTGGASKYNYPQIRYTERSEASVELARIFGAPYMIHKPLIPKSLRKTAVEMGKVAVVYEAGEAERYDPFAIHEGLTGIRRVLSHAGMMAPEEPMREVINIRKTTWVRAHAAGLFLWTHASGDQVAKGQKLGDIHDPQGQQFHPVLAPRAGYIIGHNNAAVVSSGDALFHLGWT
ncbi:MAG: succinylglutamate desuccinylase/aspartoacylase family protein [Saprospiraceae bacterium]